MDDMNNLKDFLERKMIVLEGYDRGESIPCCRYFSIDDLKELRYLASLALVEALCEEHGKIMTDILKENNHDKA